MQDQSNWSDFAIIHPQIITTLLQKGFQHPTKVQAEIFKDYKHYYNFLVASQTGSGKTLAFAAPIISELLSIISTGRLQQLPDCIICLILTPTRELAQQIQQCVGMLLEGQTTIRVCSIIGGMSMQKQRRIIIKKKPNFVIGTPGRLQELMQEELIQFKKVKYLVVDEADRMIELGHFKQVDEILSAIFEPKLQETYEPDFNKITNNLQVTQKSHSNFYIQDGLSKNLHFDINSIPSDNLFQLPASMTEFLCSQFPNANNKPQKDINEKKQKLKKKKKNLNERKFKNQEEDFFNNRKRRIFFISATLTKEFKGVKYFEKRQREIKDQGKKKKLPEDMAELESKAPKLKALLSRVKFSSKPKIIDLSATFFLPPKLIQKVSFSDDEVERISILLSYLTELPARSKVIIFGNTIKVCRRIQFFLDQLKIPNSNLHSQMQQKQRLKRLESFNATNGFKVLISTDLAARGLDFNITHVVQYGVPVNGDAYVHRAGRTARRAKEGENLILVDRKEADKWIQINQAVQFDSRKKLQKFTPYHQTMQEMTTKVKNLQWIRINQQQTDNSAFRKRQGDEAMALGVELEEQTGKANDLQEEQIRSHKIKTKVAEIRRKIQQPQKTPGIKWKRNKLILSPAEIKGLIAGSF